MANLFIKVMIVIDNARALRSFKKEEQDFNYLTWMTDFKFESSRLTSLKMQPFYTIAAMIES